MSSIPPTKLLAPSVSVPFVGILQLDPAMILAGFAAVFTHSGRRQYRQRSFFASSQSEQGEHVDANGR